MLVEFVAVFPLLWLLITATIEIGWWVHVNNVTSQAARAGVRAAAIDGASSDDVAQAVHDSIDGGGLRTDRVEIELSFDGQVVATGTDSLGLVCVTDGAPLIEVRVHYAHQPLMPSSDSPLLGGLGGLVGAVDTAASLPAEAQWRPGVSGPQLSTGPVTCP